MRTVYEMSEKYKICTEDIIFVLLSQNGINGDLPYARIRFVLYPTNHQLFCTAQKLGCEKLFLALPVNKQSPFSIACDGILRYNEVMLGSVSDLYNDTCDTHYTRNEGHVINLNPISKSQCHGCKFCHTVVQNANDVKERIVDQCGLDNFLNEFMLQHKLEDLSSIIQIALVTGGFNSEEKLVNYIKLVASVATKYNFTGEILYFGAELTASGINQLTDLPVQLVYCYTVECFTRRETMLKRVKAE